MIDAAPAPCFASAQAPVPSLVTSVHVAAAPRPGLQAVVVVPVKDEADNLPATLATLAAQTDPSGEPLADGFFEVIVLANNCRDQSAAIARRFAQAHPSLVLHVVEVTLPPAQANIGWARRLLMDEACRRLERTGSSTAFIASTDGDTLVTPTWLASTAAELATYRAAAVCGRILTTAAAPAKSCPVRRYHLRDAAYRLLYARLEAELDPSATDPWPRHHQHFGASFAITAAAYRRVGGLPPVAYLEDEALYQALRRHDLGVRHSPKVRVYTSDRQDGRVAVGLSWQLREWATLSARHQEPLVASAAHLAETLVLRRQLRQLWKHTRPAGVPELIQDEQHRETAQLAVQLGISRAALAAHLRTAATFGELWEWVETEVLTKADWAQRGQLVPLSEALRELRQKMAALTRTVA